MNSDIPTLAAEQVAVPQTEVKPLPKGYLDMTGQRYGKLTMLSFAGRFNGATYWNARCDCGALKRVKAGLVRHGSTTSCGCVQKDIVRKLKWKHGCAASGIDVPEYRVWASMKARCSNPNGRQYDDYGGRGITVCEGFLEFPKFLAVAGRRPTKRHQIDRIENDLSYSCGGCDECRRKQWPMNVRWVTRIVNTNNTRRNRYITIDGIRKSVSEWARIFGVVSPETACRRIKEGWDEVEAVTVSKEDAIERGGKQRAVEVNPRSRVYTFNGVSAKLSEWARRMGMNVTSLSERIAKHGVEKALGTPKGEPIGRGHFWNGKYYTVAALAREVGMTRDLLHTRLRYGWSLERAINTPSKKKPIASQQFELV